MPTVITPCGGGSGGSGIQFDTEPQAGTWLYVETTGQRPGWFGLELHASGGEDMYLHTTGGGGVFIQSQNGGGIDLNSSGSIVSNAITSFEAYTDFGGFMTLGSDTITIGANTINLDINNNAGEVVKVRLGGGTVLSVVADGAGSVTYHIKTGAAWVADL